MKQNSKIFLVLLLGTLSAFAPFILDLYLPSFPNLAAFFATPAAMVQLTLTTGMLGVACGQLVIGPLSDKYGRRLPLIYSLLAFILSTLFIIFSPNITTLIVLRFIQGLAASGSIVIARAIVADLYSGRELVRFYGLLMAINGVAPIISPIIGGLLLLFTDWRGMFILLALLGGVVLLACLKLNETLLPEKRLSSPVWQSFKPFKQILTNKTFMAYTAMQALLLGAMFAYIAASPFIFQQFYGLNSLAFSLCFAANGTALIIGTSTGGKLTNAQALKRGMTGSLASAVYLAVILLSQSPVGLLEVGFFFLLLFIGLMLPALSALAMSAEKQYVGSASALFGFASFVVGGLVSPLVGLGNILIPTAIVIIVCNLFALVCYGKIKATI